MCGIRCDSSTFVERFRPGKSTMPSLLERKGFEEAKERKPGTRSLVYVSLKRAALVEVLWSSCQCAEDEMLIECEHGKEGGEEDDDDRRKGSRTGRTKMKRKRSG
jgi:hypothetical protein